MAKKGSLFINIGARVDGFKKGLNKSMRMLRGYKKRISRMMPSLPGGMLGALGLGIGATGMLGVLMNASPKFAKEISRITDMIAPLASKIGDRLSPFVAKLADMLPALVDDVFKFAGVMVQGYQDLQKQMVEFGATVGDWLGKSLYGDPSETTTKEELETLREIRDELKSQGKSGNAAAVENEFKKGTDIGYQMAAPEFVTPRFM